MKKGEVTVNFLVEVVAALAFFGIVAVIIGPYLYDMLFGVAGEGSCQASLLAVSKTTQSVATKALIGELSPKCPINRVSVTMGSLAQLHGQAREAIESGYGLGGTGPVSAATVDAPSATVGYKDYFSGSELGYNKWALQKIVADNLVSCYEKTTLGKQEVADGLFSMMGLFPSGLNDFACLLCARISLDSETKTYFRERGVTQLDTYPFLVYHVVPKKEMMYADYLTQRDPKDYYAYWLSQVSTINLNEPAAVLFAAKSTFATPGQRIENVVQLLVPGGVAMHISKQLIAPQTRIAGAPGVYPYEKIASDVLAGIPQEKLAPLLLTRESYARGKCSVIIGD